jgi:hypothetical protein
MFSIPQFFLSFARLCNLWDFGTSESRSMKIRQLDIHNQIHPFATRNLASSRVEYPRLISSNRQYSRCDTGMASSSLASATHDHSLGLSASPLHYVHLRELWHPILVPPFYKTPRSDVDFSPLVLATLQLHKFHCQAPMHLSREFPKS